MTTVVWIAVAFFCAVVVAVLVGLVVLGLRAWQQVKAVRAGLLQSLGELTAAVGTLEQRVGHVESRSAELQAAIDRLNTSIARARVLAGAVQEVRESVGRVRGLIPQK